MPAGNLSLVPGDLVRIVAPSDKGPPEALPAYTQYVESLGLVAVMKPDIYDPDHPLYSNEDEYRANDLLEALLDPDCKAIWCMLGGAGCIRLIKYLEAQLPVAPPPSFKILIGFNDITVLHLYLKEKYNWPTLHGLMLDDVVKNPDSESALALRAVLFNVATTICEPTMRRLDSREDFVPIDDVPVLGGNMTLVDTSIGTGWQIRASNAIIFLEDTDRAGYRVERSLDHMKQAGVFKDAKAVVLGDFLNPDNEDLINLVLKRFAEDDEQGYVQCPVFKLEGIGHGSVNYPLPLNCMASITLQNEELKTYTLCINNQLGIAKN